MDPWDKNTVRVLTNIEFFKKLMEIAKKEDPLFSLNKYDSFDRLLNHIIKIFIEVYESD